MKQKILLILAAALLLACLPGCGAAAPEPGRLSIVAAIFPVYDWVLHILGDNPAGAEVTLLLDRGVDLHSYQATAADILKLTRCDLFIYVGGESDDWVQDALAEAANRDMITVNLLEALGDAAREEETVEGMQGDGPEEDGAGEYDEHVWLSLRNAAILTAAISDALQALDPAHADAYRRSADAYTQQLDALDARYEETVAAATGDTLLFADRFPFRYLTEDYGLSYYAAFSGCSAETEASFATVAFLARKVDELALPAVLTLEGSDRALAETVVANTQTKRQTILTMDSMQSTTKHAIENGASYLSIMEDNLAVLTAALNREA